MTVATRLAKFVTKVKASADRTVAETILQQLGGPGKLSAMTGAKNFIKGANWLGFDIGRNASKANRVQIVYNRATDLYDLILKTYSARTLQEKQYSADYKLDVAALRRAFTSRTGLELSLGTMTGRPSNANPGQPILPPQKPAAAPAPAPKKAPYRDPQYSKMQKLLDGLSADQRDVLKDILNNARRKT